MRYWGEASHAQAPCNRTSPHSSPQHTQNWAAEGNAVEYFCRAWSYLQSSSISGDSSSSASIHETLLCIGLAAGNTRYSTGGQGRCLAPLKEKGMLCLKGGQSCASAEGRNEMACSKEIQMLKLFPITLPGDGYCKYHHDHTAPLLS